MTDPAGRRIGRHRRADRARDIHPGDFCTVDVGHESVVVIGPQDKLSSRFERGGHRKGPPDVERVMDIDHAVHRRGFPDDARVPVAEAAWGDFPGRVQPGVQGRAPIGLRLVRPSPPMPWVAVGHEGVGREARGRRRLTDLHG